MNKELKELDDLISNAWWVGELSDPAKLWWNDNYSAIVKAIEGENNG